MKKKDTEGIKKKDILYDVLSFTLTVPHTATKGFRGKKIYYHELTNCMNKLCSLKFWEENILDSKYDFKAVQSDNGAHIYVNGLIFVAQESQNRNKIHRLLLINWNRLTIDELNSRKVFSESNIQGILKSNKFLTRADVARLDPRGSTIISIETI